MPKANASPSRLAATGKEKAGEPRRETYECGLVDALVLARGYPSAELDMRTGYSAGNFAVERAKGFPSRRYQLVLEMALRCSVWSDEREFNLRCCCLYRHGIDPALAEVPELRALIARLSIEHRLPPSASRDQLIETILNHCAISGNENKNRKARS